MPFINKLKNFQKIYIIIITSLLFLNTIFILKLHAVSFKVSKVEISENFDLNFTKEKVFDKAFKVAFDELLSMVTTSIDKKKINNTNLLTIKSLIDSFNVSDEKFINNKYHAKFNVNFNKKNTLKFFEKNNIFPSMPKKLDILLIPILINTNKNKLIIYNENPIYKNWNNNFKNFHLLNYILLNEDIENRHILNQNLNAIEDFDFKDIINKYDLNNYIINIIYKDLNKIKVLSKIKLNNNYKIINQSFSSIDLNEQASLNALIANLKTAYEDSWKKINRINTSIKLPITVFLSSKDHIKIQSFEKLINNLDLVSDFYILYFNNKNIFYKIIYNGSPNKFFKDIENHGLLITKNEQNWKIE